MDSCVSTLGANTHLGNLSKCGLTGRENGVLGKNTRGSPNKSLWVDQLGKGFSYEKRAKKIIPRVSCSVITSENGKETLVSHFCSLLHLNNILWYLIFWLISWIMIMLFLLG